MVLKHGHLAAKRGVAAGLHVSRADNDVGVEGAEDRSVEADVKVNIVSWALVSECDDWTSINSGREELSSAHVNGSVKGADSESCEPGIKLSAQFSLSWASWLNDNLWAVDNWLSTHLVDGRTNCFVRRSVVLDGEIPAAVFNFVWSLSEKTPFASVLDTERAVQVGSLVRAWVHT